jgi:hypothetical protein
MPIYEEQCRKCNKVNERVDLTPNTITQPCKWCGGETDRIYSLYTPKIWPVFTTTNILPHGEPVTVKGPGQLRQLEAEHGVKMADGPPPQTVMS